MTKHEIIDETVEYYSIDPRSRRAASKNTQDCYYYKTGEDGIISMCAIGRCMIDPEAIEVIHGGNSVVTFLDDTLLTEDYRGHAAGFWVNLQRLHDWDDHWDDQGLSEKGRLYVQSLKKKYND